MRSVPASVACIGLGLLSAGCDALTGLRYNREGIGPELYQADIAETTRLQDDYIRFICQQAAPSPVDAERCATDTLLPTGWSLLVLAGMNDIDRRCDAFLTWIDYRRRNDKSWAKQISDTIAAATTIMGAADTAQKSMTIVGAALGYGANTFDNYSARLLTTAEQSTIQSVVLSAQRRFREDLTPAKLARINNRPMAIHALRAYLRICMPFNIETKINSLVTIAERTGPAGVEAVQDRPLIGAITDVNMPMRPPPRPRPPPPDEIRRGPFEPTLQPAQIRDLQRAACLPVNGRFTPQTRAALLKFLNDNNKKDQSAPTVLTIGDRDTLMEILDAGPKC